MDKSFHDRAVAEYARHRARPQSPDIKLFVAVVVIFAAALLTIVVMAR